MKLYFVSASWNDIYYCVNSSLRFLKSASQWVIKCEICVLTFLTNHLTARVQKELELYIRDVEMVAFLTHWNSHKNIYGFKSAGMKASRKCQKL